MADRAPAGARGRAGVIAVQPRVPGFSRLARASALAAAAFAAVVGSARPLFAEDGDPQPVRAEVACSVPHFDGRVVSAVWPETCAARAPCSIERELTLEHGGGRRVFGVDGTTRDGDPAPPALACRNGFIELDWRGQSLHFEFRDDAVLLSRADRLRIAALWRAPEARTPEGIAAHESLAAALRLVEMGSDGAALGPSRPRGDVDDLVELAELVSIRDHLRAGDFRIAEARIAELEASQGRTKGQRLGSKLAPHLVELRHELTSARRRTLPFSLGPRRFAGGAQRLLRTPLDVGGPPDLFFREGDLCVVDVAPAERAGSPTAPAWPEERMHCFAPGAVTARAAEPRAVPQSSAANLAYLDVDTVWDHCKRGVLLAQRPFPEGEACEGGRVVGAGELLAVVDGDAMLAVSHGELTLVRSAAGTERVSPSRARELVAGSAGTRLFARTASYFADSRHIVQVAGAETKTWDVFGDPPEGVSWVGTPLVSPDQRFIVAQSGDGYGAVSLWVFPIR